MREFLLASRWLLIPFYVGLVLALVELLAKVVERVYQVATQFLDLTEEGVLLSALSVVDLTLSASLIVIVMLSGYANFVSRFDVMGHEEWPRWIADIDFSALKVKLMASIVAITAIKLLEAFMDAGHETDRDLAGRRASTSSSSCRLCWSRSQTGSAIATGTASTERAYFSITTFRHSGGSCASVSGGLGLLGAGCNTASVNHQASDLSHPSPGGRGSCGWHSVSPAGQAIRIWKW